MTYYSWAGHELGVLESYTIARDHEERRAEIAQAATALAEQYRTQAAAPPTDPTPRYFYTTRSILRNSAKAIAERANNGSLLAGHAVAMLRQATTIPSAKWPEEIRTVYEGIANDLYHILRIP